MDITLYLADQNPHRDRSLGITNMTLGLLAELARNPDLHLTTIGSKTSAPFSIEGVNQRRFPWATDRGLPRLLTDNLHPFLPHPPTDLWYYPKGYISRIGRPHAKTVITMHDMILQHYADRYPASRSKANFSYWLGLAADSIRRADRILTISRNAEQQIREFCERRNIQPPPIQITYEACGFEHLQPDDTAKQDYVLHLASNAPHKKSAMLIDWWQSPGALPPLHLVGNRNETTAAIHSLPRMSQNALIQTIRQARALILPSEIEGFGLPALEAYYVGTPVVYAKGTAVEEILQVGTTKGGFILDDRDSFEAALDEALAMDEQEIATVGAKLREAFSWKRFGDAVVEGFTETLAS
ncbi:MAG: glycosyltransferase involved in cell wall biosynthesis [Candidatus Omnitrophota bacterium]|jgi:glycosyltransferase involved in cell wall biosynthesis